MHDTYCDLIRLCSDEQTAQRCIAWLDKTDFFVAPASTKYHDAHRCGLVKHTLLVAKVMLDLAKLPQFSGINITEAIQTALVHDWCKINFYEEYTRNVKDQDTGAWFEQKAYRCKGSQIPLGHGVTSLYMAMRFFRISIEQALAIRWHMSDYTASEHEKYDPNKYMIFLKSTSKSISTCDNSILNFSPSHTHTQKNSTRKAGTHLYHMSILHVDRRPGVSEGFLPPHCSSAGVSRLFWVLGPHWGPVNLPVFPPRLLTLYS